MRRTRPKGKATPVTATTPSRLWPSFSTERPPPLAEPVDFVVSERQYADHLLPIWFALSEEERGTFYWQADVERHLIEAGVEGWALRRGKVPPSTTRLTVVASYNDLIVSRPRPIVLVNHGVGQIYRGDPRAARHPAYSGGEQREDVVLLLCPSERDARVNRERYPDQHSEVVGCPKLDRWQGRRSLGDRDAVSRSRDPVVAVSFHFPLGLCPETMWAFPEYFKAVAELGRHRHVIGHGHPRAWDRLLPFYEEAGIEPVKHFGDVLDRADVYVCDNSSTIYEFASTDRPVVLLNSAMYRRDVEHGLRFWECADVGVQVDRPEDLAAAIDEALEDPPERAAIRRRISADLYAWRDGRCARRAADAIRSAAVELATRRPHEVRTKQARDPYRARRRKVSLPEQERPGADLPLRRLIRVGASTSQMTRAQAAWGAMSPEERDAEASRIADLSDDELAEQLAQEREDYDAVTGAVDGRD